jgi:hypothetical protein
VNRMGLRGSSGHPPPQDRKPEERQETRTTQWLRRFHELSRSGLTFEEAMARAAYEFPEAK